MDSVRKENLFRQRVYDIVARIPKGKVVTYGQIALVAGIPRAAREVGWVAHTGPSDLPWQRVVNRFGGLAKGYPGGQLGQKAEIEKDGVVVGDDMTVDLVKYQWWPDKEVQQRLRLPPEIVNEINGKIPFSQEQLSFHRRGRPKTPPNSD
jgi:methylated-DNA-protein-cysteine methyltransferase-like protein